MISGALTVSGTFTSAGAAALSPANANVTISPTGTGTFNANPATTGTFNNINIGATTPGTGKFRSLAATGQLVGGDTTTNDNASADKSAK